MADIASELLELKDHALAATKLADGEFYRGYLHDDAIAITPYAVFDKEVVILGSSSSPRSTSATPTVGKVSSTSKRRCSAKGLG